MNNDKPHKLLQRILAKKKKDFKGFSLRWIALQLGISHVYLSQMLKGTRPLALNIVEPLCEILDIDIETKAKVIDEIFNKKGYRPLSVSKRSRIQNQAHWHLLPVKDLDLISTWETLAIVQTTLLRTYDGTPEFIGNRLFLPPQRVKSILDRLIERGYVQIKNGKPSATNEFYEIQSRASKDQIRSYHKSVMMKAQDALNQHDEVSLKERLITSAVFTTSNENVPYLKNKIADFLKQLIEESSLMPPDCVYQFGIQFFPVTRADS